MNHSSFPKKAQSVKIHGRVVGKIDGSNLQKRVWYSKHFNRMYSGWAWDVSVIEIAERKGVTTVEVIDDENGWVYQAMLNEFRDHGVYFDWGWGEQVCLPLKFWRATKP
jgi:hypothetical protein